MFKVLTFILCLFCLWTAINGQFFGNDPVKFDVKSIINCAENGIWGWNINVKSINNTFVSLSMNATIDRDFDDHVSFIAEFFQINSKNEWKKVAKLAKKKTCSFLKNMAGQLFVDVCKEMGLPNGKCPVPKGQYKVDNRLIDVQDTALAKFLTGKFKGIIQGFTPKKEPLFCGEIIFVTSKL